MRETKGPPGLTAQLTNQLGTLCALQGVHERLLFQLTGPCQGIKLKLASHDGSQAQGLLHRRRQSPHPRLDRHPHALWDSQPILARPVPSPPFIIQLATVHQRLAHLFDKEGIALRFPVDAVQELGRDLLGEQVDQHIAGALSPEAK